MSVTIVLGSQWGDEGKGKLVDILASTADMCCRAAGGNNAGHTIVANGITYDFHIIPSGMINPNCKINVIGPGCVVHIPSFFKELAALEEKGIQGVKDRIFIADRAHVCFDLHSVVDGVSEDKLKGIADGKGMIGTTRRGIGPCYSDKVARHGVPFWMLVGEGQRWEPRLRDMESAYRALYGDGALQGYNLNDEIQKLKEYRTELQNFVIPIEPLLNGAVKSGSPEASGVSGGHPAPRPKNILIEGANALFLDVDHGTYPYVTSSNTGLGGALTSLPGLHRGSTIIGVVKAYTTRVGSGPFPTELDSTIAGVSGVDVEYGRKLQEIGREFGVTTGRKRRCGWLDLIMLKYSCFVNEYTHINLTKLDVLDTFEEIRIATGYTDKSTGYKHETFPADLDMMENMKIEYKTFAGWQTTTTGCKTFAQLPEKAREYVEYIERELGVPVKWIGTGPGREDMIVR